MTLQPKGEPRCKECIKQIKRDANNAEIINIMSERIKYLMDDSRFICNIVLALLS